MCLFFGKKKILAEQKALAEKIDALQKETTALKETLLTTVNSAVSSVVSTSNQAVFGGLNTSMKEMRESIAAVLGTNEKRIEEMKTTLDKNLDSIRQDNEKRLTEMRQVVEEKLTTSLNERLTQAFSSVNESLAKVNQGLGEMKNLTGGVTDLKKMLGNVKTRGVFGEVSLSNILMNILTTEQYKEQFNLSSRGEDDGRHIVDFVVVLPGQSKDQEVYLPIDAKFPLEDYQRLVSASDLGDPEGVSEASKAVVNAIKKQAKSINENYIRPPKTVDFAIMYLPIEGLYAEVVRNAGLLEDMRTKYKVIPAGPTTVTALLNSLQIGFRTLAVQKSSKEIYDSLVRFRKDFTTFVELLEKAQNQIDTVGNTLAAATKRTSMITKNLDKMENITPPSLPEG